MTERDANASAQGRSSKRSSAWINRAGTLTVTLPLLVFFICTAVYLFRVSRLIRHDLTPILAQEASQELNREVHLKDLELLPPGTVTLDGVGISDGPTFVKGIPPLATADKVVIRYGFLAFLFDPGNAAHAIRDVTVTHPTISIARLPESDYNFSDIFAHKSGSPKKPFDGIVKVHDGRVLFTDYLAPAIPSPAPAFNDLSGVEATVDFSSERRAIYTVRGHEGASRALSNVTVRGTASRLHGSEYALFVHVNDGDLAYWSTYFKALPQFRVEGGRGDAQIQLVHGGVGTPLDLEGDVQFRNASVHVTDSRTVRSLITNVTGSAHFSNATVQTEGTFALNGQRAAASGILYNFARPHVQVSVGLVNVNVDRLAQAIPAIHLPPGLSSGPAAAQVSFTGLAGDPVIAADVTSGRIDFVGHAATDVRLHCLYYHRIFTIPQANCVFPNGGRGTAVLSVDSTGREPEVRAGGAIRGYDLAQLLPAGTASREAGLRGRGDFDFIANGGSGPLTLQANLRSSSLSVRGIKVDQAAGRITWPNGGEIHVDRFLARGPNGTVSVTGEVPVLPSGQPWALAVDASGIDLAPVSRPFTSAAVQGVASFNGSVVGSVSAPTVRGKVQIFGGRYGSYSVDSVAGAFAWNPDRLSLSGVTLRRYPTEANLSGVLTGMTTGKPAADLTIKFARADIEDFAALAQQFRFPRSPKLSHGIGDQVQMALSTLTGTVEGDVHLTGPLSDPSVKGETVITDATIGAYRVSRARADFDYRNSLLQIDHGLVSIEGSDITATGSYHLSSGVINGIFAGSDFDLTRFRRYIKPYAEASGTIDFSGSIAGTTSDPTAEVGVVGHSVKIDGQQLADFSLFAQDDDGIITQTGDPWTLTVLPSNQIDSPLGPTEYVIKSFHLDTPSPNHPDRPTRIALTGSIPQDSPETIKHLFATIRNSTLAETPAGRSLLENFDRVPQPFTGEISADSIAIEGTPAALNVTASLQVNNLVVGRDRADMSAIQINSIDRGERISTATVNSKGITLAGLHLDDLNASGSFAGRVITVDSLKAESNQSYFVTSGTANLDGDMNGTVDASGIPLALFNTFLPPTRSLAGQISSLWINATGPTRSPDFSASVTLEKPAVTVRTTGSDPSAALQPASQVYALDRIRSGVVTLRSLGATGDRVLSISDLSAYKDGSPVAVLSGTVPLKWTTGIIPAPDLSESKSFAAHLMVQDLGALAALNPMVDPARTGGSLQASLLPSADNPGELAGHVGLVGGSFALLGISTTFQQIAGEATFNSRGFKIVNFGLKSSATGSISMTGGGTFGANPRVDLTVTAKEFGVNEAGGQTLLSKLYSSAFRGKINGIVHVSGPSLAPIMETSAGPLVLSDVVGTIPTPQTSPSTPAITFAVDPSINVVVVVGDKNRPAQLEKSNLIQASVGGEITLGGKLSSPTMVANLEVYKGQVLIPPSTPLKLVYPYSTVTLTYPVQTTDPTGQVQSVLQTTVDLYAQAKVSVRPSTLASYQSVGLGGMSLPSGPASIVPGSAQDTPVRYTINVHIHGVLGDPNNFFIDPPTSDPVGLNTDQMYAAIGGYSGLLSRNPNIALQDQMNAVLTGVLLPGVFRPVEASIENSLGLDVFSVDYSNNQPISLTLTKSLNNKFAVTYTQLFGARDNPVITTTDVNPLYTIELSYSLSKRLQFSVSTDSLHNNTAGLVGVYNF